MADSSSSVIQELDLLVSLSPVSIIVAGQHHKVGKLFLDMARANPDQFHEPIDVRRWLHRDPASEGKKFQTPHQHNADNTNVAMELLSHEEFYQAVVAVTNMIVETHTEQKIYSVYCTAGQHRSDGVAKAVARVLNLPDYLPARFFNANVFSLAYAHHSSFKETVVADALRWTVEPWLVRYETRPWGEAAAVESFQAFQMIERIDTFAGKLHRHVFGASTVTWGDGRVVGDGGMASADDFIREEGDDQADEVEATVEQAGASTVEAKVEQAVIHLDDSQEDEQAIVDPPSRKRSSPPWRATESSSVRDHEPVVQSTVGVQVAVAKAQPRHWRGQDTPIGSRPPAKKAKSATSAEGPATGSGAGSTWAAMTAQEQALSKSDASAKSEAVGSSKPGASSKSDAAGSSKPGADRSSKSVVVPPEEEHHHEYVEGGTCPVCKGSGWFPDVTTIDTAEAWSTNKKRNNHSEETQKQKMGKPKKKKKQLRHGRRFNEIIIPR